MFDFITLKFWRCFNFITYWVVGLAAMVAILSVGFIALLIHSIFNRKAAL